MHTHTHTHTHTVSCRMISQPWNIDKERICYQKFHFAMRKTIVAIVLLLSSLCFKILNHPHADPHQLYTPEDSF